MPDTFKVKKGCGLFKRALLTFALSCDLSTIANGGSATVQIVVTTNTTGEKVKNAGVSSTTADPSLANNSASASTSVNFGQFLPLICRY